MKKLTDEIMAKALGWKHVNPCSGKRACKWIKPPHYACGDLVILPRFTTSLDAIVREIEARGLFPSVMKMWNTEWQAIIYPNGEPPKLGTQAFNKTAPLALCHALLNYLKRPQ